MNEQNQLIDSVLDSYPMVPLPAGFVQSTMRAIQPNIRFRLQFLDFAIPALIAVLMMLIMGIILWLNGFLALPSIPTPELTFSFQSTFSQLPTNLLFAIFLAVETIVIVIACVYIALWESSLIPFKLFSE